MKLVVLNKEEINIEPGASLSRMSTEIEKYTDLENLENKLTKENLKVANITKREKRFIWPREKERTMGKKKLCILPPLL